MTDRQTNGQTGDKHERFKKGQTNLQGGQGNIWGCFLVMLAFAGAADWEHRDSFTDLGFGGCDRAFFWPKKFYPPSNWKQFFGLMQCCKFVVICNILQ